MNTIQIIAFTHKQFNFDEIGLFHLDDNQRIGFLTNLKTKLDIEELMYLSTCNRVEFIISREKKINKSFVEKLIKNLLADQIPTNLKDIVDRAEIMDNKAAVHHIFSVASSIDSLVVGEREIITQVRKAFEECKENDLCGDVIRVLVQSTISTAKKVYTESNIGTRPVSIVSLAFLELKKYISKKTQKNISYWCW